MKKRLIALGVLAALVFVLAGCVGSPSMSSAWSGTGISRNTLVDSWTISAKTLNGHATRNEDLNADHLAALHANNTNSGGKVSLILTQGDIEKTFDITGEFDEGIDASDFAPGRIR